MIQVHVDGLLFEFPNGSSVSKYDDWAFYRRQFSSICGGAKAVDIVYLDSRREAWFIEVKDYRRHPRTKTQELGDEVAAKVRDTLAGLVAASVYANDHVERTFAKNAITADKLKVVLHLEQPVSASRIFGVPINRSNLVLKLKQTLKAIDAHPKVMEKSFLHPSVAWTVA